MSKKLGMPDFYSPEARTETDEELIEVTTKGKNKKPDFATSW